MKKEQLVPSLALKSPNKACIRNSSLSLGHLNLAMSFILDQLLVERIYNWDRHQLSIRLVPMNAIDARVLLLLKPIVCMRSCASEAYATAMSSFHATMPKYRHMRQEPLPL